MGISLFGLQALGVAIRNRTMTHPGYVTGRWYLPYTDVFVQANAVVSGTVKLGPPFFLAQRVTISDLGTRLFGSSSGGKIQLAIYASDPLTHLPVGAALAVTGDISTTATGAVSGDITGADVTLEAGWYWGAVNADNSTATAMSTRSDVIKAHATIGSTTLANALPQTTLGLLYSVASTYGTWPNLTSSAPSESASAGHALIAFKVSGVG